MRINFNVSTSFSCLEDITFPRWLEPHIQEFMHSWDLHVESPDAMVWVTDIHGGLKELAIWLQSRGWNAKFYEMEYTDSNDMPLSYGIEFADDCQRFMEERLRTCGST